MGSFSILNNPSAINGQHQLNINNVNLNRTLQRMSSGLRINTGADDAAGLQIADTLRANVYALNQGVRNANDGISYLQVADGALAEITNILTRMVTLASEAASEPIDVNGRIALNKEFQTLQEEIARIAKDTNFNGSNIFHSSREFGTTLDLFVGDLSRNAPADKPYNDYGYIKVKIGYIFTSIASNYVHAADHGVGYDKANTDNSDFKISSVSLSATSQSDKIVGMFTASISADLKKLDSGALAAMYNTTAGFASLSSVHLLTHENAANAFNGIKTCLNAIAEMRGDIGAGMNRLQAAISVLQTQSRNTLAAESSIRDANMAEEITNLTRFQILAQTGIASLAHSNSNSQIVLNLLR